MEAAVFDLLTMQRDRSIGNIFLQESGNIMLIDNNQVLGSSLDSLFLPFTRRHTMAQVGRKFFASQSPNDLLEYPLVEARLDYRCHANGPIGKNYPVHLHQCLESISVSQVDKIMPELGLEDRAMASRLKQSASSMLEENLFKNCMLVDVTSEEYEVGKRDIDFVCFFFLYPKVSFLALVVRSRCPYC